MATKITPEMDALAKRFVAERNVAESTAKTYLNSLYALNDKRPFKNLAFLRDTETIAKRLEPYAESSKSSMLGAVVSALYLFKDSKAYKKAFVHYEKMAQEKQKERREKEDTGEKTQKQKENWIEWAEVKKVKDTLAERAGKVGRIISFADYEALLHNCVLGLYTDLPPRRNQDYTLMTVVRSPYHPNVSHETVAEMLPKDKNYLLVDMNCEPKHFVFNVYKTAKTYGREILDATPAAASLRPYLARHPALLDKPKKQWPIEFPFLVNGSNEPLSAINAITRILNKVFAKNVGSSMLRHIYLSAKYDLNEMEADAKGMGHSTAQQRQYLKRSAPAASEVQPPPPLAPPIEPLPSAGTPPSVPILMG